MPSTELGKERRRRSCVQLPTPVPLASLIPLGPGFAGLFRTDEDAARSFVLSRLWKKFWSTSCWVCPVPPGLVADAGPEGDTGDRAPEIMVGDVDEPMFDRPGRPDVEAGLPLGSLPPGAAIALADPPMPDSISLSARSTFGKLNVLLPMGPTTPAVGPE